MLHRERKEDVEKENLVAPDESLFLSLLVEPARPLVLHQLILKPIVSGHVRDKVLEGGGEVVLQKPELDRMLGVFENTQHHDPVHMCWCVIQCVCEFTYNICICMLYMRHMCI